MRNLSRLKITGYQVVFHWNVHQIKALCCENLSFIAILKSQIIFRLEANIFTWTVLLKAIRSDQKCTNLNGFKRNLNNIFALNGWISLDVWDLGLLRRILDRTISVSQIIYFESRDALSSLNEVIFCKTKIF